MIEGRAAYAGPFGCWQPFNIRPGFRLILRIFHQIKKQVHNVIRIPAN